MSKKRTKGTEIAYCGHCGEMIVPGSSIDGWNRNTGDPYNKLWYKCKNKKHWWDAHDQYSNSENPDRVYGWM
jgi:hypothetical protein